MPGPQPCEETIALPINIKDLDFSGGTWTYAHNDGIPVTARTAVADTTSIITVPIHIPLPLADVGYKLTGVNLRYRASTADLTSYSTTLFKTNTYLALTAGGTITATTITTTDTGGVTSTTLDKLLAVSVTTPAYLSSTGTVNIVSYSLRVTMLPATTTNLRVFGAEALLTRV